MAAKVVQEMEVFYFGEGRTPLYGCYHPVIPTRNHIAAVFCPPFGGEAVRVHRAYRRLANRLSRKGIPSLRFDYFGTGDSSGDDAEATLQRWEADVLTAVEEVKNRSHAPHVALIGLRLGASLAARAASHRPDISRLVLWEPVITGANYLLELAESHRTQLQHSLALPDETDKPANASIELLGFVVSSVLRSELRRLSLFDVHFTVAFPEVLMIERSPTNPVLQLNRHLQAESCRVTYEAVDDPAVWLENPDRALIPAKTLKAISGWLSENPS